MRLATVEALSMPRFGRKVEQVSVWALPQSARSTVGSAE